MTFQTESAAQTTHRAMGTVMAHQAFGPQAKESLAAVCSEIARLEGLLSRFLPGSDVSRVNRSAGIKSERLSPETYRVLSEAVAFSACLPGSFDVTIAPLVALWQMSQASGIAPDKARVKQALPLVNFRDLILDPQRQNARLRNVGQSVDLGGIGKGFAGDRILEVLKRYGITSAYSNLGGNVVTLGAKPDGTPWQIGIQHPRQERGLIGAVAAVNETVVTSGDYQRCFADRQGKRRHHILDPTTGYPADSGLISVSIVTAQSLAADPLSTIVFVAGMEQGRALLKNWAETEAVLVDANLKVYITPGLRHRFQAANGIQVSVLD